MGEIPVEDDSKQRNTGELNNTIVVQYQQSKMSFVPRLNTRTKERKPYSK